MKHTTGIDVRPLREITGDSLFNEVYFDDVLLPADAVIGDVDDGWRSPGTRSATNASTWPTS